MEAIINNSNISWVNLLTWSLILWLLYLGLRFFENLLSKVNILGKIQANIKLGLHYLLLLYEPIAILILGSMFVLINPILHGLILLILLAGGFNIIRDYISGRILQFDRSIMKGNRLSSQNVQGIISETGRLGLKLRNNKGLQFINYACLLSDGYLLLSGEDIGAYYHLKITPDERATKVNHLQKLKDVLVTSPYLDWHHRPDLQLMDETNQQIQAKVMVKEEQHLRDLLSLIRDWGYHCKISKK